MSFKPEIAPILIGNEALALLPSDPIQDFDEIGIEAREVRRFYKTVVATLLERHHFNLATKRQALAVLGTNDRSVEWLYAYQKPNDMAYPVSLLTPDNAAAVTGWFRQDDYYYLPSGMRMMQQAGNTLYANTEAAALEYTSYAITEADFTARFKELAVLWLAAKICHPITKDKVRARELAAEAEFQTQRTIASDLNRNGQTYGNKPTESEMVRGVGYTQIGGHPLDPVRFPAFGLLSAAAVSETGY